jgi:hypothetical protein
LGFSEGVLPKLGQHMHHYRAEFDGDAQRLLGAFDWRFSLLRPEDEQ